MERRETVTHFFCGKHLAELQARWHGQLADMYPGEEIKLDPGKCEYLGCLLARRDSCPTCGQPLPAEQ